MSTFESIQTEHVDISELGAGAIAELRSDHAGETGAVYIYLGLLAVGKDPTLRQFANAHLTTEQRHLKTLDDLLPKHIQSKCLPLWRLAGVVFRRLGRNGRTAFRIRYHSCRRNVCCRTLPAAIRAVSIAAAGSTRGVLCG